MPTLPGRDDNCPTAVGRVASGPVPEVCPKGRYETHLHRAHIGRLNLPANRSNGSYQVRALREPAQGVLEMEHEVIRSEAQIGGEHAPECVVHDHRKYHSE